MVELLSRNGVWRSLVARFVRDEEAVGSNPATPTIGPTLKPTVPPWRGFCLPPKVARIRQAGGAHGSQEVDDEQP